MWSSYKITPSYIKETFVPFYLSTLGRYLPVFSAHDQPPTYLASSLMAKLPSLPSTGVRWKNNEGFMSHFEVMTCEKGRLRSRQERNKGQERPSKARKKERDWKERTPYSRRSFSRRHTWKDVWKYLSQTSFNH